MRHAAIPVAVLAVAVGLWAAGKEPASKPQSKPAAKPEVKVEKEPGPFLGEYEGALTPPPRGGPSAFVKVFGTGGENYKVVLVIPGHQDQKETRVEMTGKAEGEKLAFSGKLGDEEFRGTLQGGKIEIQSGGQAPRKFEGKMSVRKSPTEGQKPPAGAAVLLPFDEGRPTNLDAWTNKKWKLLPDGSVEAGGGDNVTAKGFGDMQLHVEFMLPYMPSATGQGRGNSGVYIQERYEIQVLDSFGLVPRFNDCGSIYRQTPPKADACLPPLRWQTYDITFRAPRVDAAGKVVKNAVITVVLNGVKVHDNAEMPSPTGAAKSKPPVKAAPLKLQDHGTPVRFRNIWLTELKDE